MFSKEQQKAIQEKYVQLKRVKEGVLTPKRLMNLISQRRVNWINENLNEMLNKYRGLTPEEQAHRIIFLEHMKINPDCSEVIRVSPNIIQINSYNFCPYLESCNKLELDTRFVCKEIGEPPIQKMIEIIHPKLKFSRNYNNIRPHNCLYCEEYIELLT